MLDVSGIALTDPFAALEPIGGLLAQPVTGKVLAGGSVVLSDDSGYVVAQAGSVIDVSGTSASFDVPQAAAPGILGGQIYSYAPQPVWSNAGSITLAASAGLDFDGTLIAHAGAPQGQGGSLAILPELQSGSVATASLPSATAVILQQSGTFAPTQSLSGAPSGVLHFAVDELTGSGISTLIIGGTATSGNVPVVPVGFAGNVNLSLDNAVIINTTELVALAAGTGMFSAPTAGTSSIGAPVVSISAPYVAIAGPVWSGNVSATNPITTQSLADGTLAVNASFIDLENQVSLENFGQANFISSGDIRLSSTNTSGNSTLSPGVLFTPGNLTFQAADLYPASGSAFIIDASGPTNTVTNDQAPTTITFLSNGASSVPLSAGGRC